MIINNEKIENTKKALKETLDCIKAIDSKSNITVLYETFYNIIENCSTFSQMFISLRYYKECMILLNTFDKDAKDVLDSIIYEIKYYMHGTEEERLLKAIEYLKD